MKKVLLNFKPCIVVTEHSNWKKNWQYDQAYRDNIAKEILSTEKDYVSNLAVCIEVLHFF